MTTFLIWGGFILAVLVLLFIDLRVLGRGAQTLSTGAAARITLLWIAVATAFGVGITFWRGTESGLAFFTGYVIEYSLSMDNVFVFVLLFSYFGVPAAYQRRVLLWGILGALVMRGLMIIAGAALIERFEAVLYAFGVLLIVSGIRMGLQREESVRAENPLIVLVRKVIPVTDDFEGDRFFLRRGSRWMATPLFIALVAIESTDLLFAIDSVPAVFGITTDSFIVYSSNVFAVLGLRALYFVLSDGVARLYYLRLGLATILVYVGLEMLLARWIHVPVGVSLLVIVSALGIAGLASLVRVRRIAVRSQAVPDASVRLCEVDQTEIAADDAFGCRRHVQVDTSDPGLGRLPADPLLTDDLSIVSQDAREP